MIVAGRYCGPPGSGNGGYVAGLAAAYLEGAAVEVTLRRPPPLDEPMAVDRDGDALRVAHEGQVVVEAAVAPLDLDVPEPVTYPDAVDASTRFPWDAGSHPFPTCFVCGPARRPGDGLRLFPGAVPGRALVAAPWVPDGSVTAADGDVRPEVLWAALDCPTYFGATLDRQDRPRMVLGRMTARVVGRPRPGDRLVVVGWGLGHDRRKSVGGSAVLGADGAVLALARAVWIAVPETS